ncbi:uncharacterized protein LOC141911091 isoform X2 [Tubulanus polymorphus]|uniref:uncharacterized protein LOC141911091 isoform X2 n=1 Tax=Tubulanus polymorphus TaxID=672921 RepID=UPI003DA389D3
MFRDHFLLLLGPCVGMDCLHGVLMHGDAEDGEQHQNEHIMEKIQEDSKPREQFGPCDGTHCKHAEHQREEKVAFGPDQVAEQGPKDAMEAMHGVLMHGDNQQGHGHKSADESAARKKIDRNPDGPKDAMESHHGVLMHGDDNQGDEHGKEDEDLREVEPELVDSAVRLPNEVPVAGLGKAPADEKKDFENWQKAVGDDKPGAAGDSGEAPVRKRDPSYFSFRYIADSVYDEIEQLKTRYLKRKAPDEKRDEEETRAEQLKRLSRRQADIDADEPARVNAHDRNSRATGSNGDEF